MGATRTPPDIDTYGMDTYKNKKRPHESTGAPSQPRYPPDTRPPRHTPAWLSAGTVVGTRRRERRCQLAHLTVTRAPAAHVHSFPIAHCQFTPWSKGPPSRPADERNPVAGGTVRPVAVAVATAAVAPTRSEPLHRQGHGVGIAPSPSASGRSSRGCHPHVGNPTARVTHLQKTQRRGGVRP